MKPLDHVEAEDMDTLVEDIVSLAKQSHETGDEKKDSLPDLLEGHLTGANSQVMLIQQILTDSFDAIIKKAQASKAELISIMEHNREINKAAVQAVKQATDIATVLEKQHDGLVKAFKTVADARHSEKVS